MKFVVRLSLLSLLLAALAQAESVEEIIQRHNRAQAKDLQAYLEAHPDAEDKGEAVDTLVRLKMQLGEGSDTTALLKQRYQELVGQDPLPLNPLMGQAIFPLLSVYVNEGMADEGRAFLEQIKKDLKGNENYDRVVRSVERMASRFNLPQIGQTMDIAFTGLDGKEHSLAALKGKPVLVDFWATWCGPCVREIPNVKAAYDKYKDKGFEVLGISLDRDPDALKNFIKEKDLPWPQCLDSEDANGFAEKFGISAIPSTFLVGPEGNIIATDLRGDDLERELAKLLP